MIYKPEPDGYSRLTPEDWAEMLESGTYTQVNGMWDNGDGGDLCCLSVLALGLGWETEIHGEYEECLDYVEEWLKEQKLPDTDVFVKMNDGIKHSIHSTFDTPGKSFNQIAAEIRHRIKEQKNGQVPSN